MKPETPGRLTVLVCRRWQTTELEVADELLVDIYLNNNNTSNNNNNNNNNTNNNNNNNTDTNTNKKPKTPSRDERLIDLLFWLVGGGRESTLR